MSGLSVTVLGGGIGGCSAAVALAAAGHSVQVLELRKALDFQSSGIFVYSNGLAALQDLGVLDGILATGFAVPGGRNVYYDHTGAEIVTTRYPTARGGAIPAILGIKRGALQRVLTERMTTLGVRIRLGAEATALDADTATLSLSTGETVRADLLVGADGVRSWVRSQIAPEVVPRATGFGVWRSVHRRPETLTDKIMMMGPAKRYGIMPISEGHLYTFGTVAHAPDARIPPETWVSEMRAAFAEFEGPAGPLLGELGAESEVYFTSVEEVALPLPWHRGRTLLIGDASHAATPFMGQGGTMAMQDAVVLAEVLAQVPDVEMALRTFGEMRAPMCRFVQDVSRAVGEAGANEDVAQLPARNARLAETAQSAVDRFYGKLAELDQEAADLLSRTSASGAT